MLRSYSQQVNGHSADIHLFKNFINVRNCNGIFLEMGACDGILYSNTKALEDYLGFTGVLIEPGKNDYAKLIRNRPNCKNYNYAISNDEGIFDYIGDSTAVGGLINNFDSTWIKDWNLDRKNIQKVQTKKLSTILSETNIKYIDFWSLDVEGSELDVLKSMDWTIPIYIIVIETGHHRYKEITEQCRKILRQQGFSCDGIQYGLDEWWINDNYFRKDLLFNK